MGPMHGTIAHNSRREQLAAVRNLSGLRYTPNYEEEHPILILYYITTNYKP